MSSLLWIQWNLSLWTPQRCEHLLVWTLFICSISIFYIIKRPLRCEHILMWTLFTCSISIFYIIKSPLKCEHFLMWTLFTSEMWTPPNVNNFYQFHFNPLNYERTSEMWTPPNVNTFYLFRLNLLHHKTTSDMWTQFMWTLFTSSISILYIMKWPLHLLV